MVSLRGYDSGMNLRANSTFRAGDWSRLEGLLVPKLTVGAQNAANAVLEISQGIVPVASGDLKRSGGTAVEWKGTTVTGFVTYGAYTRHTSSSAWVAAAPKARWRWTISLQPGRIGGSGLHSARARHGARPGDGRVSRSAGGLATLPRRSICGSPTTFAVGVSGRRITAVLEIFSNRIHPSSAFGWQISAHASPSRVPALLVQVERCRHAGTACVVRIVAPQFARSARRACR